MTRWLDPPALPIPAAFDDLNLHPLVAQTLVRRGITSSDSAQAYLNSESVPSTPFPEVGKSVDILKLAMRKGKRICVWGDFDVDGQTSTALLVQTLNTLGSEVIHYIPIRGRESHGLHIDSLKPILDQGIELVLTCDTGITSHQAVDFAISHGAEVILTDHHDPGDSLPYANAILNPKLLAEDHPLRNLSGVGVAYKLAEALLEDVRPAVDKSLSSKDLLDLVALGLIADVALLTGETRSLARRGIQVLRNTSRLGLKAIAELSGTNLETLTEETVGFTFAPRLNALGRLSDANPAVELLLTKNPARARVLAAQIEGLNAQRRLLTSQVYESAEAQLRENPGFLDDAAIVLSHEDWPGGVVGIVASRLAEQYHKPAMLLTESEDGILRGSARSIEGLHITQVIASQKEILLGYGGHPMAAGFSLPADKLGEFRRGMGKAIEGQLGEKALEEPTLQIDSWIGLNDVNLTLAGALESLAPFGAGNPQLILATQNVLLKSSKDIGKTREHRRIMVVDENGNEQDLLWWNGAGEDFPDTETKFDIAYSIRTGTYRGQKQLTLQFVDFRIVREAPIEVRKTKFEVIDLRTAPDQIESLPVGTLVWAEGGDRDKGRSRFELHPAEELAIYTSPPSPVELRYALEMVKPRRVRVIASPPAEEKSEEFLTRLAGLCKYTLNQRKGAVILQELASAMAARESAVQIGLEWLAAGGQLTIETEGDTVKLSAEKREKNPYLQAELFIALRGILKETAAFRRFLATTDNLEDFFLVK
ncbi:MAG: single-stranded-DNA-specific exonuclease RecJ [Chloroflexi bacterium]|nr:single-stranded-DNA-specific exonuclease RecJ [Chloroflexota bacterium]